MAIAEALLRHVYKYDQTLPLLATSEPEAVLDVATREPVEGLLRERVTFGSTHDERVLATVTYPAEGGPYAAVIIQHGSTPLGRHTWALPGRPPLPVEWAQAGLLTVAVDAYGFGSRERPDNRGRLGPERSDLMFRTRDARIQAIQDLMRTVDYLQTRDDVQPNAIGYAGVSMGCRVGVPFVAMDSRVGAAAFFIGGSGPYSRWALDGSGYEDLAGDEQLVFELTDPIVFAPMTAGRPMFMANGERDELVEVEPGQRLQKALGEPKELHWFAGGHFEIPSELYDAARDFLRERLLVAAPIAAR